MEKELFRSQEAKKITLIGFCINAVLTVFKIFAGIIGKSGAMIADGVHSFSDLLTDIVVLAGFKLTEQPEDECHNYGHGKYETLASVMVSVFLAAAGYKILKSAVGNIMSVIHGEILPKPGIIALAAAAASIVVKELLYHYTLAAGNRINSFALTANAWHHRSDAFSSIGILFGIGGAIILGEKWTILDPVASLIVSLLIFKVAFDIFMPSINELMESALTKNERKQIKCILLNCQGVKSFHKLRTRRIGTRAVIEFHILVDNLLDIKTAHDIATNIEFKLKKVFGESSIITIHIEPFENQKNQVG